MFGRCLSYGDGNTFWPLGEAIKTGAGITRTDSPEEGLEKLASLAGDQQREVVQRVATAIGFGTRPAGLDETFWAARAFFEGIAAHQPLVLIFDDLQWAEPAFLDLLDYLATCSSGHPILIVCLSRPELLEVRPDWGATDERRAHLRLTSLAPDESNQLIRRLLGAAELAATEVEWIATASGGNPLFLETLVEMLVEERRLEIRDGRWEPSATVPSPLPATVDALLAARLDGLDATSQTVLNCASVLGYTFARPRLAALTPDISPGDLDNILAELVEGDFIRHDETKRGDEDALRFAHILLRDAVYNSILKGERADLHLRVARELERRAGERGVELQELLGYHLECAYRHLESLRPVNDNDRAIGRNASGWLSAAGRRALAGGDMQAAVRLLERALALLPGDDAARSDLLLRLSIAYAEMGEAAQADALVSERIMAEHRGRPFLAYRDDKGRQRVVDLDERDSRVTVGRRSDNDISIPWDGEVSRLHAVLDRGRFGWTVTDDGMSRNGSFVNGSSVSGSKSLEDGDVLRFGDTIILYRAPTTTTVQPEIGGTRATTFVSLSLLPMLTDGERKLLEALCQSWDLASGRSEERAIRVTTDLGLEQQEVREVLHVLFAKLHVEQATPAQELAQLVGRARSLGLATEPVGRDS
jgi:predicted ATPase